MDVSGFAARELSAVMLGTKIARSLKKFVVKTVKFTKFGFKSLRGRLFVDRGKALPQERKMTNDYQECSEESGC